MKTHIDYESESDRRTWWLNNTGGAARDNLTVRDYFAAKAMEAMIIGLESGKEHQIAIIPETAYQIADVMMKARELDQQGEL